MKRTQFAPDAESDTVAVDSIPDDWFGLDVGPKTVSAFEEAVAPCKTIVSEGEGGGPIDPFAHNLDDTGTENTTGQSQQVANY